MRPRGTIGFSIVTGFLGAGKTTLVNRLLRSGALPDALVLVNEWGEIGLDHLLYERIAGDAVLVAGGCVCCALRGDLVDALRDALARRGSDAMPAFGRIVLETTGLAEPAPILHALAADAELAACLRPASVTTVVDAVNGLATLGARAEAERQAAFADRLVLTKSDLLPMDERAVRLARIEDALRTINPVAPILGRDEIEPGALFDFPALTRFRATAAGGGLGTGSGLRTFAFRADQPIDPGALQSFLGLLGVILGPKLLRLKGLIAVAGDPVTPVLVEGVQHLLHPPRALPRWPDDDRGTRLVVIVEPSAARHVERLWAALTRAPAIDAPDLSALVDNPLAPRSGGLLA